MLELLIAQVTPLSPEPEDELDDELLELLLDDELLDELLDDELELDELLLDEELELLLDDELEVFSLSAGGVPL
jgi:hypothetical protein